MEIVSLPTISGFWIIVKGEIELKGNFFFLALFIIICLLFVFLFSGFLLWDFFFLFWFSFLGWGLGVVTSLFVRGFSLSSFLCLSFVLNNYEVNFSSWSHFENNMLSVWVMSSSSAYLLIQMLIFQGLPFIFGIHKWFPSLTLSKVDLPQLSVSTECTVQ